jgi:hypothetical protein
MHADPKTRRAQQPVWPRTAYKEVNLCAYAYTARYPWAPQGRSDQSGLLVVYDAAFQPPSYWNGVFVYPKAADVAIDTVGETHSLNIRWS